MNMLKNRYVNNLVLIAGIILCMLFAFISSLRIKGLFRSALEILSLLAK